MSGRRTKWHPPPPPTPRILHLPRRTRRSRTAKTPSLKPPSARPQMEAGKNLGTLFNLERPLNGGERRRRVEACSSGESVGDSGEERWRVEAEILRAECNFLRMEKEAALRKLEMNRAQTEAALKSAMETLISGRKKIRDSGEVGAMLEEKIEELEEKLAELQENGKSGCSLVLPKSCRSNFDRQASVLRRRLEKMAEETCEKEIREIAVLTLSSKQQDKEDEEEGVSLNQHCRFHEVEKLRRKMEGLSKGMLEKVEEYDHLLISASAGNSTSRRVTAKATTRYGGGNQSQHLDMAGKARASNHQQVGMVKGGEETELKKCSCRELVGRIVEQVRAETKQWAEMQALLGQVRVEMEELKSSRDLWQSRANSSEVNLRSMHNQMLEWKQRVQTSENTAIELKKRIVDLKFELQTLKAKLFSPPAPVSRTHTDIWNSEVSKIRGQQQRSLDSHKENEKHVLVCRLKNSKSGIPKRSPLQEIGNLPRRRN